MQRFFIICLIILIASGCISSNSAKGINNPSKDKTVPYVPSLEDQLDDLTAQIILSLSQERKSKIAIIEFADLQGNISEFGRFLAEELITRLYLTGQFEVIERQLLNKVLEEHQLMMSGIVDENSAKELGRILGVDAICSGSIADMVNSVKVNARLISAESGRIFSVASAEIVKTDIIRKLMGENIKSDLTQIQQTESTTPEPEKPLPISISVNSNDYDFELVSSEMFDRTVRFNLIVINQEENDRDLTIWLRKTKFFDQMGSEYIVSAVRLANTETQPKNPNSNWGGSARISKKLISGVPTPLELTFEAVSSQVESVSLLEINCGKMTVEFRDLYLQ